MRDYRLYFFVRGHIMHADEFQAADDTAALLHVEDQRDHRVVELWSLNRLVAKIPAREDR